MEVRLSLEILLAIIGGGVSLMFGIVLANIKKLGQRNEERFRERTEREYIMNRYFFSIGTLSIHTAELLMKHEGIDDQTLEQDITEAKTNKKTYYDKIDKWRTEYDMKG